MTRPRHAAPVVFLDQSGKLGGAELFLADLAQACRRWSRVLLLEDGPFVELLRDRGVFVEAIALPDDAKQLSKSAGILDVLKTAPRLLAFYHEVRRRLDGADLIYCNTPKAIVLGGLVAWLSKRNLVVHLHDLLSDEHFSDLNLKLLGFFARRGGLVIANSQATAETFKATGGKPWVVEVVYNGFEPVEFRASGQLLAGGTARETWPARWAGLRDFRTPDSLERTARGHRSIALAARGSSCRSGRGPFHGRRPRLPR